MLEPGTTIGVTEIVMMHQGVPYYYLRTLIEPSESTGGTKVNCPYCHKRVAVPDGLYQDLWTKAVWLDCTHCFEPFVIACTPEAQIA